MTPGTTSDRVTTIQHIFEDAQQAAEEELDDNSLIAHLEGFAPIYRSIAYEAAAMSRGIQDFAEGIGLPRWTAFMTRTLAHEVNIHIGLGWAIAQQKFLSLPIFSNIPPLMQPRLLDGFGYCDGTFRQRSTIQNKIVPDAIQHCDMKYAWYQGIGRRLWYISRGEVARIPSLMADFPAEYTPDLWRGIGIAATYVGGADEQTLLSLYSLSGIYDIQLATGAVLVAQSRHHAGSLNDETDLTCGIWCGMSAADAALMADRAAEKVSGSADLYLDFISEVEAELKKT